MSQKRQPDEGNSPEEKRRRFTWKSVVQEVIRRQAARSLEPILEPLIRRVVKEEVEITLRKYLANIKRNSGKDVDSSDSRSLKLQFSNDLSLPLFTGARIGEECSAVKVVLIDALTGNIVDSGPASHATVEIVVLEGDFDGDVGDNWTPEDFNNNVVREREGKKPLLTGDVLLNLKEGIGTVGEISFTDNSSWTRSRKFRLGARVVDNSDGIRIREAKTESFIVRDHRGELYKKHHPPSLFDEVWRLEKIGKDGAFHKRLSRENINTVKDFLTMLFLDFPRLRCILGTGMSAKMWEVTIAHAQTCVLDKRVYSYFHPGSQQKTGVLFNNVGQIVGLLSESQYVPVDKLSETEKANAQNLVIAAFDHWEEVIPFNDETSLAGGSSHLSNVPYTTSLPRPENSDGSKILGLQESAGFDHACHPSASSSDIISSMYSVEGMSALDDHGLHSMENMGLRYDKNLGFPVQFHNSLISDTDSIIQAFCDEDNFPSFTDLQSQNFIPETQTDLQSTVDSLQARSVVKAQSRWTKISSVLKWFSIRKLVIERRLGLRNS
uniref:Uncharacterized protein LOC105139567 n=2 Tax=Rhizophora mucronata TaxID=61149 RepID=A0A2P2KBB6_RHIMU